MSHAQPRGLSRRRVEQLLAGTKDDDSTGSRVDTLSRHFLGYSYKPTPLIGSADTAEVFTATWIGPYRGTTPADAREVAELIVSSGLKAEAFDDLRPAQWSKLIFNASVNS